MTLSTTSSTSANLANLPTIAINSSATSAQTTVNFFINNMGVNVEGIQVGLSNLPSASTSTLMSNVPNWTPNTVTQGQSISTVAIDFTLANPIPSTFTSAIETLTINQGNVTTPLGLSNFTITTQDTPGKFADLKLLATGYNVNITGSVGFSFPASSVAGNYTGGTGVNTLIFPDAYSKYVITNLGNNNFNVTYSVNGSLDTIQSFSRLQFQDKGLAFDLSGAAGQVAKIIGAIYGASSVSTPSLVGIGLTQMNQGMSYQNLISMALSNKLVPNFTNAQEVTLLFQNLAHATPSASDLSTWTNLISNGTYTQTSLAQFACDNAINANNINLTGLSQTGLAYTL